MDTIKETSSTEYTYRKGYFVLSIVGPIVMLAGILLWAIFDRMAGNHNIISQMAITVVPVLLFSSLIAMNHPIKIVDDGKKLTFYGFYQQHEYNWSEIDYLRIRKFMMSDRIFLRIGKERVMGGRYWIDVDSMQGASELFKKMIPYDSQYELNNISKMKASKKA